MAVTEKMIKITFEVNQSNFFGIEISDIRINELIKIIKDNVSNNIKTHIVCLNPNKLLLLQENIDLLNLIRHTAIFICDGIGIQIAAKLFSSKIKNRITGIDLMIELCKLSVINNHKLYLLGNYNTPTEKCVNSLRNEFPLINIVGFHNIKPINNSSCWDGKMIDMINSCNVDIIFVALGAINQEQWIERYKEHLKATIFIGVGGSFDVLGGRIDRAPIWSRKIGLEWMYRLVMEPKRLLHRYFFGIPVFFYMVGKYYYRQKIFYR